MTKEPTRPHSNMNILTIFVVAFLTVVSWCSFLVAGQTFEIYTVVGHRFYDGEGGLASRVAVNKPESVAFHPITGELFIADTYNHVIRKIDSVSGVITTVAGIQRTPDYSGDGGLATQAHLNYPACIAFNPDGQSMYIADYLNNRVRMVKDGIITTVAGNGDLGFGGDGVLATSTSLNRPSSVTVLPTNVMADWQPKQTYFIPSALPSTQMVNYCTLLIMIIIV